MELSAMGPYTFAQSFLCGFFGFAAIASFFSNAAHGRGRS